MAAKICVASTAELGDSFLTVRLLVGLVGLLACKAPGGNAGTHYDGAVDAADAVVHDVNAGANDAPTDVIWPVGTLKVKVLDAPAFSMPGSVPQVGDSVVFTDVYQTQVVVTDSNGEAAATVSGPTAVTHVHFWFADRIEARTIIGAMPGDEILLHRIGPDYTSRAPVVVNYAQAEGKGYSAHGPCGSAIGPNAPLTLPMRENCWTNPATVTLIEAQGTELSYASSNVAYDPITGGSVTFSQFTPGPKYTGTFTNVPAWVASISFLFMEAGGGSRQDWTPSPTTTTTLEVQGWRGPRAHLVSQFESTSTERQRIKVDIDNSTTGYSANVSAALLPWLGQTRTDTTTKTFKAPVLSTGASYDYFVGAFAFVRADGAGVVWSIIAEAPNNFAVPFIPSSVTDLTPVSEGGSGALLIEADALSGFSDARRNPMGAYRAARDGTGFSIISKTATHVPYWW